MITADRSTRAVPKFRRRFLGAIWRLWITAWGGSVGKRLEIDHRACLRWPPHRGICIGNDVYIGIGAVIDAPKGASLLIGDGVKLMHYTVVAVKESISIGGETQVAEFSSIRDSDHGMDRVKPMKLQEVSTPVEIGRDVWIGRGVAVLRGSRIGDGAVLGANSVARGDIPPFGIAVGAPARVVRMRPE